eukprot:7666474-Lingulodinium_polyedra.AAC.1
MRPGVGRCRSGGRSKRPASGGRGQPLCRIGEAQGRARPPGAVPRRAILRHRGSCSTALPRS